FETKHAIGLVSEEGVEAMIHVGMDTVSMKGEGFTAHVAAGDTVKAGDLLLDVDLDAVRAAGHPAVTPVVITNTAQYQAIEVLKYGEVSHNEEVLTVK